MFVRIYVLAFMVFCSCFVSVAVADEVRVAVGSNFLTTLNEIVTNFQKDTRHTVVISSGSSGKLYAQIKHGAPFDVFLSADAERPELLEAEGLAVKGSRFVYAVGRLTLWSPDSNVVNGDGQIALSKGHFDHLAIANPKTAPYGRAAQQTLKKMGLWESDRSGGKHRTGVSVCVFEKRSARICGAFPSVGSQNQRERQPVGCANVLSRITWPRSGPVRDWTESCRCQNISGFCQRR